MTALYHAYTQTVADGTATSVVRPSDWNSAHVQSQTLSGNTAGVSSFAGTNIVLQGGNNVTLSAVTAASAATIVISGANTVAQSVQTQASGAIAGTGFTSTTTAGTAVVATQGTNGLSMAVPAYITTYVNDLTSGRAGTGFTSTTTAGTAITAALGTNGLSMAVPAFVTTFDATSGRAGTGFTSTTTAGTAITAALGTNGLSMAVPAYITTYVNDLTSGRAGTGFTSTTTAGTAVTAALGTNGLSMAVPAYVTTYDATSGRAGTGTTLALTNLSGTLSVNTNGVALSLNNSDDNFYGWNLVGNTAGTTSTSLTTEAPIYFSGGNNITLSGNSNTIVISAGAGGGTTNQTGPNIADGNGVTITDGTVVFSNSNGVSFGLAGSTMTASVNLGAGIAIADGGGTASTGTVVFSNSNNITFGLNNNTITASYADPYETILLYPPSNITTVGQNINNSLTVMFLPLDHNLKANRLDLLGSISVATNNNTSSAAMLWTVSAVMYTRNGNTLSSVSSTTQVGEVRWQSNSTASVTGARLFSAPLVVSTDQGYYWLGLQLSTRATGHTGAATTSLGNTVSMMGVGSAQFGAFTVGDFGAATNSSNSWFPTGMYSGTTNLAAVALSNISYVGTLGNRAQVAIRMLST